MVFFVSQLYRNFIESSTSIIVRVVVIRGVESIANTGDCSTDKLHTLKINQESTIPPNSNFFGMMVKIGFNSKFDNSELMNN